MNNQLTTGSSSKYGPYNDGVHHIYKNSTWSKDISIMHTDSVSDLITQLI